MDEKHNLISYLATIGAITLLALVAAIVCVSLEVETKLAQIVAALGFISAAITGLIGIAGTFKGRQAGMSEASTDKLIDKVPPTQDDTK